MSDSRARYEDDNDDDALLFTYGLHGAVIQVDDAVRVYYANEMRNGEVLQIAKNGRYLKVQLDTGEVLDVLLSNIEEI